jgi:Ca2+-binding RTX toxin-like protein
MDGLGGNDILFGLDGNDTLHGSSGNDSLYGQSGDDLLYGDEGSDHLEGGAGADILDGGPGNDHMEGGPGEDTYIFARGYGHDEIADSDAAPGNSIRLGDGILPGDVQVRREGNDLKLTITDTGDTLRVKEWVKNEVAGYGSSEIRFADGTTWDSATIINMCLTGTEDDTGNLYGDCVLRCRSRELWSQTRTKYRTPLEILCWNVFSSIRNDRAVS